MVNFCLLLSFRFRRQIVEKLGIMDLTYNTYFSPIFNMLQGIKDGFKLRLMISIVLYLCSNILYSSLVWISLREFWEKLCGGKFYFPLGYFWWVEELLATNQNGIYIFLSAKQKQEQWKKWVKDVSWDKTVYTKLRIGAICIDWQDLGFSEGHFRVARHGYLKFETMIVIIQSCQVKGFRIILILKTNFINRDVLFEFHLKFWNTAIIDIPVRSLL